MSENWRKLSNLKANIYLHCISIFEYFLLLYLMGVDVDGGGIMDGKFVLSHEELFGWKVVC